MTWCLITVELGVLYHLQMSQYCVITVPPAPVAATGGGSLGGVFGTAIFGAVFLIGLFFGYAGFELFFFLFFLAGP